MAKESTVGYLPGNDPAAMQANLDYQNALMRMEEALNARQNRFLDPQMLALAQGFLAPTQTGGFGESLGMAAKNIREAQQQEEKEERDIAQARLGLAGRGIELERLKQRDREFARLMGGEPTPGGAPSGPLSTPGAKPGPLTEVKPPPGFEGVTGIPVSPPNPNFMTGRQYLGMARLDPSIAPTTAIKDAQDLEKKRYEVREGGVQDLASGMFYAFPKGELVERQIFGQEGTFKVDARTAALLDMYAANGDPRYYEVAERVVKGPKAPPRPGERPKVGEPGAEEPEGKDGKPGRISSVQETEAKAAGMKEEAQLTAKEQSEESKKWYSRADDASSVMNDYRILRGIFDPRQNKSASLMTGIFEKGDVASQVGTLLESGLTGESLKTAARKIATNAGLNDTQIAQFQTAVGVMASIKLKASRIMEGQGTITEAERLLIAESAIAITDSPKTVLAKTELFMARAKFEEKRGRALREFRDSGKGNYNQFVLSPEYTRIKNDYQNEVERVVEKRLGIKIPRDEQGSRDNAGAASRLPEDLR